MDLMPPCARLVIITGLCPIYWLDMVSIIPELIINWGRSQSLLDTPLSGNEK
jgi:hypothetical protein